jgi:pyruvate kinase
MRRHRKAKIIATLGPASSDPEIIEELYQAGADIFRLNLSHGKHEDHQARLFHIRQLQRKVGRPIGILLDLQGPKLRVGRLHGGEVHLGDGAELRLELSEGIAKGSARRRRSPFPTPRCSRR